MGGLDLSHPFHFPIAAIRAACRLATPEQELMSRRVSQIEHDREHLITRNGNPNSFGEWLAKSGSVRRTQAMMRELGVVPLRDVKQPGFYWITVCQPSQQGLGIAHGETCIAEWLNDIRAWRINSHTDLLDEHDARVLKYIDPPDVQQETHHD